MGSISKKAPLQVIYGDLTLGLKGESGFHYIFSYPAGGPVSLVIQEKEWLYRSPRPCFWRAVTDNDRGNGFPLRSGMWLAADSFIQCVDVKVEVDGCRIPLPVGPENNRYSAEERAERVKVIYTYQTITVPETEVEVSYETEGDGSIEVGVHYFGKKKLPQLPVLGMRFILPTCAEGFRYQGLSGETYPDRKAGGVPGIYQIKGLPVTPYLVPQDCGMHMDTDWLEIDRTTVLDNTLKTHRTGTLRFEMNKLAFSCLPYTALELENATHQEELPPQRRTVVCIYGAVRGVGGIDSWGADVESAYHIDAEKDIRFMFRICGA